MIVKVIPSPRSAKQFTVELQQGAQFFRLDYTGNQPECRWMAKMFRVALKHHDAELAPKPVAKTRKPKTTTPEDIDSQFKTAKQLINAVNQ